ncbi:bacteriocin biosynthesis protein [Sphaerisporangium album]|uniref:Bacteriocin biosynthesis protein n=1 Tax=Sphaerisporangium album TaxID=509200 RepID=A0A367ELR4_9ACTN|nr:thiopeptide-type bacteriocin biosynthesis protein [Sphaerisporangium album]RCG19048.1 bacteriocin biosynthesis protein [Sphaerisporangium album]
MDDATDGTGTRWRQINITYPGNGRDREQHASTHLTRILPTAETAGTITAWWFIRKGPWRIRYQLPDPTRPDPVRGLLADGMRWTSDIYEPETHAFGGPDSMNTAHALFHGDSRHLIDFLSGDAPDRRERSLILLTTLMRAAGLDWTEQGGVWAQVAEQRAPLLSQPPDPTTWAQFTSGVRRLLLGTAHPGALPDSWLAAFQEAGGALRQIRERGDLTRGIRAVTALHVIHHWNRIGLPARGQAMFAQAAKEAVFSAARRPEGVTDS